MQCSPIRVLTVAVDGFAGSQDGVSRPLTPLSNANADSELAAAVFHKTFPDIFRMTQVTSFFVDARRQEALVI
jgi:hypothetical protein